MAEVDDRHICRLPDSAIMVTTSCFININAKARKERVVREKEKRSSKRGYVDRSDRNSE